MNYNTLRKFSFGNVLQDVETKELFLELKLFDARFPAKDLFLNLVKFESYFRIETKDKYREDLEIYFNNISGKGAYALFLQDTYSKTVYPVSHEEMQHFIIYLNSHYDLLKYCIGKSTRVLPYEVVKNPPYSKEGPTSEYEKLRSSIFNTYEEALEAVKICNKFNPVGFSILRTMPKE